MKQEEKLKEERLAELLKKADGHPMMKQIMKEEAAKVLQVRQEAAGRIGAMQQEAERVIPGLLADLGELEQELTRHNEAKKDILKRLSTARVKLAEARGDLDRERSAAENILLSNYDGTIDTAIQWFRDKHDGLMMKKADHSTYKTGSDIFTMSKKFVTYSNAPSIVAALTYTRVSIQILEAMKLVPEIDLEKIETLKAGIPDIATLTEITREKPLPRINTDPRSLLPSDSEMDWKFGKLMEKAKKILGKQY